MQETWRGCVDQDRMDGTWSGWWEPGGDAGRIGRV